MEYRRHYRAGGTYFFTVVTQSRKPILIDNIERLRAAFSYVRDKYPFEIDAVVVLPDHLHTIWRLPDGDYNYSQRWMLLKRKFSAGFNSRQKTCSQLNKREKGIWQRRFWEHTIRNEDDWRRHMDYVHYNPVKHGYVDSPAMWPHSSFLHAVRKGWYPYDWGETEPQTTLGLERE